MIFNTTHTFNPALKVFLGKDSLWSDNNKDYANIYKVIIFKKNEEIFVQSYHDGGFAYTDKKFPSELQKKLEEELKIKFPEPLEWTEQGMQGWEQPNNINSILLNCPTTCGGLHISHLIAGKW